jgi:hypothetical protein
MSVWQLLGDPFVLTIWLPLTLIGAVVGFTFSVWPLWKVQLKWAVPAVVAVTVATAASTAWLFVPVRPENAVHLVQERHHGILADDWRQRCRVAAHVSPTTVTIASSFVDYAARE